MGCTWLAGMVEEVEHQIPTKIPIGYTQNIASDSQVQLLAFTRGNCLEKKQENGQKVRN